MTECNLTRKVRLLRMVSRLQNARAALDRAALDRAVWAAYGWDDPDPPMWMRTRFCRACWRSTWSALPARRSGRVIPGVPNRVIHRASDAFAAAQRFKIGKRRASDLLNRVLHEWTGKLSWT